MLGSSPSNLYALVDMGSNGIRFSITDLSPQTARSLPTVYQNRCGVSLFDAQYQSGEKGAIPQNIIDEVINALRLFQVVCSDFGVPPTNVRILATEATRTAINSEDYRRQIKDATGWQVDLLPKEAEGRIGAMGVASSFSEVNGLVMDLGGGSTQLTWLTSAGGKIDTSPIGSVSLPYGAAALTQQLSQISSLPSQQAEQARSQLADRMKSQFQQAYSTLQLPIHLQELARQNGLTLYLSGGGFRGWGFLHMAHHRVSPYPIPIVNGFCVNKRHWQQTTDIEKLAELAADSEQHSIFRISKRRAKQVPAVAFLVNILADTLPMIQEIRFCQGGVREGFLLDTLSPDITAQDPVSAATKQYGTSGADYLAALLKSSLPGANTLDRSLPASLTPGLLRAAVDLMYLGASQPKETRSLSALYAPITGVLAGAHGISHKDRALLALILRRRWNADLPPPHDDCQKRLQMTLTRQEAWWAQYLGAVAELIGCVYPAGTADEKQPRMRLEATWSDGLGKKGLETGVKLRLSAREGDVLTSAASINEVIEEVEKVGKKKHRVGGWNGNGEGGFGVRVHVEVERLAQLPHDSDPK